MTTHFYIDVCECEGCNKERENWKPPAWHDHKMTNEIICPYCGYEHGDSWEWADGREQEDEFECHQCQKTFSCERSISVTYSTTPITEGKIHACWRCKGPLSVDSDQSLFCPNEACSDA